MALAASSSDLDLDLDLAKVEQGLATVTLEQLEEGRKSKFSVKKKKKGPK